MYTRHIQNARTYHYAIFACEFVKAGLAGLTLIGRTTLPVGVTDVVVKVVTSKDIGDEFHD